MPSSSDLIASYGRRRGRPLRPRKQQLVDDLLPHISVTLPETGMVQPAALFPDKTTFWLEIGLGAGEHLAAQAERHPAIGMIGCETYVNGMASLLGHIDDAKLSNIRLFMDDARLLMQRLPDACIERVFILFPDPWPKARHHKRRIITAATLDMIARIMKKNGLLRLATDHAEYAEWMLLHLLADTRFAWAANCAADWNEPPADWIPTRYQMKGLAGKPAWLDFTRV